MRNLILSLFFRSDVIFTKLNVEYLQKKVSKFPNKVLFKLILAHHHLQYRVFHQNHAKYPVEYNKKFSEVIPNKIFQSCCS